MRRLLWLRATEVSMRNSSRAPSRFYRQCMQQVMSSGLPSGPSRNNGVSPSPEKRPTAFDRPSPGAGGSLHSTACWVTPPSNGSRDRVHSSRPHASPPPPLPQIQFHAWGSLVHPQPQLRLLTNASPWRAKRIGRHCFWPTRASPETTLLVRHVVTAMLRDHQRLWRHESFITSVWTSKLSRRHRSPHEGMSRPYYCLLDYKHV